MPPVFPPFGGFQSTHPVRGATKLGDKNDSVTVFQSTHPVRGATYRNHNFLISHAISIHAPREGCDSPGGDVTARAHKISIHAPREGCDVKAI